MTYHDLSRKLNDVVVNNTVYDILDPAMIIVGESSAVRRDDTEAVERGAAILVAVVQVQAVPAGVAIERLSFVAGAAPVGGATNSLWKPRMSPPVLR